MRSYLARSPSSRLAAIAIRCGAYEIPTRVRDEKGDGPDDPFLRSETQFMVAAPPRQVSVGFMRHALGRPTEKQPLIPRPSRAIGEQKKRQKKGSGVF
jgi:hypothetical protein